MDNQHSHWLEKVNREEKEQASQISSKENIEIPKILIKSWSLDTSNALWMCDA